MLQRKKIFTAGATFSVALGIGFVMQNSDVLAARPTGSEMQMVVAAGEQDQLAFSNGPELIAPMTDEDLGILAEAEQAVAVQETQAPILVAAIEPEPVFKPIPLVPQKSTPLASEVALDCSPVMTATAAPAAFAEIEINAPCHRNTGLTLHHQGMMFSAATDEKGHVSLSAPALTREAVFIAAFDTGDGAVATIEVPEVANFERAVLQWQGENAFAINAFEAGARFGEDGHISALHPRDLAALENDRGFLVRLGDSRAPQQFLAEVYTFPADAKLDVVLSVDAAITKSNCDREVTAQSIQISPDSVAEALDLVMVMPACESAGDFLVLNNMFRDLKLALN